MWQSIISERGTRRSGSARLIREAGRKAVPIREPREERFAKTGRARDQRSGRLDILVSNAGRQQAHDSILDISTEQFDWTMKTNIYAPLLDHQSRRSQACRRLLHHREPLREQAYDPHRTSTITRQTRRLR